MEGPSLVLAVQQLAPFIGKKIEQVEGNTKIGKERLIGKKIIDIFSWGKHLVFQFDTFALRVHFMLFGSFEATVGKNKVTGDYPKKNRAARLALTLKNGHLEMYSCSLRYIEISDAKGEYDFSVDVMSSAWDGGQALEKMKNFPNKEVGDLLLDQSLFSGVGNIIKNEVLFRVKVQPERTVEELSLRKLKEIVKVVGDYVFQFYAWRKKFVLRKHYQIYRQSYCPICHQKVVRKRTGERERMSYFCPHCQG